MEYFNLDTQSVHTQPNPELADFSGRLGLEIFDICTAVTGALAALEPFLVPEGRAAYITARRTLERCDSMIAKLKALAAQQNLAPERVEISTLTSNIADAHRRRLPPSLQIDFLPGREKFTIEVDRKKFRDTLAELISNACDAMNGHGHVTITTDSVLLDGTRYARVSVTDYGPGMTPTQAECALEPLVSTKASSSHRGWGLAVCGGFAHQSGGILQLTSAPHRGTTVALLLPLAPAAETYPRLHIQKTHAN